MSEARHTAGPWTADWGYRNASSVLKSWTVFAKDSDSHGPVTDLAACDDYREPEEIEANARLIASAPALLAALEQIVADWESVPEDARVPDEINDTDHWDAARAAIAAAKGSGG